MNPSSDLRSHVLPTGPKPDLVMVRGEGSYLFDDRGRRYLDFVEGWASNALGHSPAPLVSALLAQANTLWHASPAYHNSAQIELSSALAQASGFDQVFLCTTGAEANESAIKLARKWGVVHRRSAYGIVTTDGSFHGRTLATMSASGKVAFEPLFEPKVPGFRKVPFGDAEAVARVLDDGIVAVMVEPIQGEAGVVVPPTGYLRALRELTERAGILLMLDEVQTGMGRTGRLFAYEHEGIRPDVVTLAKGLGSGLPLGAMACTKEANCFTPGEQGGTHVGNALLASVGKAVLEIVSEPSFLSRVREREAELKRALTPIVAQHGIEVRGQGLLIAMTLRRPIADRVVIGCLERGLLLNAPRPDILRFMPALTVEAEEIASMANTLAGVLQELA